MTANRRDDEDEEDTSDIDQEQIDRYNRDQADKMNSHMNQEFNPGDKN